MSSEVRYRKVGLVGANGFIGSAILQELVRAGVTPRALNGPGTTLQGLAQGIEYLTCDLTETESLKSWVSGLDLVIHAAGNPSVARSFEIPEEYARVHVQGTAALLHACQMASVAQIVYVSSAEVYGRPEVNPVSENHRLQARSPYAAAKIGAERLIEAYVESFGMAATVLRPFSIYGPNPTSDSLFGSILSMAKGGRIQLQNLKPVRDYCYVDDLARAVVLACTREGDSLRIINIGTGKGTSVAEFAERILQTLGLNIPIVEEPRLSRPGRSEILELIADIAIAKDVLGWHPQTKLRDGLRLAIEHDLGAA